MGITTDDINVNDIFINMNQALRQLRSSTATVFSVYQACQAWLFFNVGMKKVHAPKPWMASSCFVKSGMACFSSILFASLALQNKPQIKNKNFYLFC